MTEIRCNQNSFTINGQEFNFPFSLPDLEEVIGEPDLMERGDLTWHVAWHKLGIYLDYASIDNILYIQCMLRPKAELRCLPETKFSGRIFVGEQLVLDGQKVMKEYFQKEIEDGSDYFYIELNSIMLSQPISKGDNQPYTIYIGKNYNYKKQISKK